MTDRSPRWLRAAVVACLVACLVACSTTATDATTAAPPAEAPTPAPAAPSVPVRVLQLNLCSSGIAACYTGRSTAAAAAMVRTVAPGLVTLNEVCQDDVAALERALAEVVPAGERDVRIPGGPGRAHRRAVPLPQRSAVRHRPRLALAGSCQTVPSTPASTRRRTPKIRRSGRGCAWRSPPARPSSPAPRTWPIRSVRSHWTSAGYLFDTVIARMRTRDGAAPVVVGGDLNLGSGDSPDLVSCLPQGSAMVDDEGQQHVVATPEFVVDGSETLDLGDTTDHPGLLVTLAARVGPRGS